MKTWIALLRGINVGGKHIVPMKELRNLLEESGYTNVKTYIQSGNVVFESASKPIGEIGQLIEGRFGFKPSVFMLSASDLDRAIMNCPYDADQGKFIHYTFFDIEPESVDYDLLNELKADSEEYSLVGQVFYLYAPDGIGRSKLVEKLHKVFSGVAMTSRNLNTIRKLKEMIVGQK